MFGFYLSVALAQNAKTHDPFVSVHTYEFKESSQIYKLWSGNVKYQIEPKVNAFGLCEVKKNLQNG